MIHKKLLLEIPMDDYIRLKKMQMDTLEAKREHVPLAKLALSLLVEKLKAERSH